MPPGSRVVHIGPHKTGTTSLQAAFHASRHEMESQGVHYVGRKRHPMAEVLSLLAREHGKPPASAPATDQPWQNLVKEVRESDAQRVVVSSEFFADAKPAAMRAVVNDLDDGSLQILVTLRPLARLLSSQWQQYVQGGLTTPYDTWLTEMLRKPKSKVSPTFWWRHRHDKLIARWAELVGAERVTVIVVDDSDHSRLLRDVEKLLALQPGTVVQPDMHGNRSLTLGEVEIVRNFNLQFTAAGLSKNLYQQVMRFGAARYVQSRTPERDEVRLTTPRWALERAGEIGAEMAVAIAARGVRVIGDLDTLGVVPEGGRPDDEPLVVNVSPEVAATVAMGTFYSSGLLDLLPDEEYERVPGMRILPTSLLANATIRRAKNRSRGIARRSRRKVLRALGLQRAQPVPEVADELDEDQALAEDSGDQ